jgi:hypothetical protein
VLRVEIFSPSLHDDFTRQNCNKEGFFVCVCVCDPKCYSKKRMLAVVIIVVVRFRSPFCSLAVIKNEFYGKLSERDKIEQFKYLLKRMCVRV